MKLATVTSSLPLTASEKEKSRKQAERIFPGHADLDFLVDATILGGLIFKADEEILDLSLKEKLTQLKNKLVL